MEAKKFNTNLVSDANTPQFQMLDVTVYKSLLETTLKSNLVNSYIVQIINIYLKYKRKKKLYIYKRVLVEFPVVASQRFKRCFI